MSVFLSRNFALTNKNLEAQLVQVKALSEKTIQQEREKAQLEAENARKTKELEQARKLQLSMLPQTVPKLPHLDIAVYMQPATEVGGDYYDFKVHDDGTLTAAIGDATGHGMQAGTMVAATKSLFNALADEPEPAIILQKATKALKEMGYRKMYMTVTIAKFQNHHMLVAAAGMPYTLIHRAVGDCVEEVALKAMPLGSFPNFKYEQKKIALEPGDTVLFLSDGLEEMFDPQGEILGAARVKELVAEAGQKPSEQIIAHLKNAGKAWANGRAQKDDVTMVVVKVTERVLQSASQKIHYN
jgi:serine phosphatase RsbU (regulator of sigma subunit)